MSGQNGGKILVVDDESDVADAYALQLQMQYDDVETAYGGEAALDAVDESVDVVLLDRRMPNVSGDEVLEAIRERGLDCRVIMTTAVNPGFDIVEMPFDDYLCKPIDKEDLFDAVDQQMQAANYEDEVSEYFQLTSKIGLLEAEKTPQELEDHDEYQQIKARAEELKADLDGFVTGFDDMEQAFMEIERS